VATFTITVDGTAYTSTALNVALTDRTQRPMLARVRSRTEKVPGMPGAYNYGADVDSLEIVLGCVFTEAAAIANVTAFRAALTTLVGYLMNPVTGQPAEVELSFSDTPGKSWTCSLADGVSVEMLTDKLGEFELVFAAHDPFAHEVEDETTAVITTSPGNMTVTNSGAIPTPAVYIVKNEGVATIHGFTLKRVKET
jgi:phage-related protein